MNYTKYTKCKCHEKLGVRLLANPVLDSTKTGASMKALCISTIL